MKKLWKWVLGIFIVIVIIAALVAVPFGLHKFMIARSGFNTQAQAQQGWNYNGPMERGDFHGNDGQQYDAPRGFDQRGGPMMGAGRFNNRGFGAFGFGLMFLGGLLRLIPLALFGLLLYGVYRLGKRDGLRSAPAVIPAPAVVQSAPKSAGESQDSQTPQI